MIEPPISLHERSRRRRLLLIKSVHTIVWAFFVACIAAIWVLALRGDVLKAAFAIAFILIEVAVLAFNRWRCPLSPIVARYTDDRSDNFDIYLPAWLAGHTMPIFGTLYIAGILLTLATWALRGFS